MERIWHNIVACLGPGLGSVCDGAYVGREGILAGSDRLRPREERNERGVRPGMDTQVDGAIIHNGIDVSCHSRPSAEQAVANAHQAAASSRVQSQEAAGWGTLLLYRLGERRCCALRTTVPCHPLRRCSSLRLLRRSSLQAQGGGAARYGGPDPGGTSPPTLP